MLSSIFLLRQVCTIEIGGVMRNIFILVIISAMQPGSLLAQEGSIKWDSICVVEPVFHCTQHLESGGAIGYFGYDLQCPDDAPDTAEVYIDISENNLFSPGSKDRGQPKVFLSGEHMDEFEVDISRAEVEAASVIQWSVQGRSATVEYFKTKDNFLDCSTMSQ